MLYMGSAGRLEDCAVRVLYGDCPSEIALRAALSGGIQDCALWLRLAAALCGCMQRRHVMREKLSIL